MSKKECSIVKMKCINVERTEGNDLISIYLAEVEGNQIFHSLQPKSHTDRQTMNDCTINSINNNLHI